MDRRQLELLIMLNWSSVFPKISTELILIFRSKKSTNIRTSRYPLSYVLKIKDEKIKIMSSMHIQKKSLHRYHTLQYEIMIKTCNSMEKLTIWTVTIIHLILSPIWIEDKYHILESKMEWKSHLKRSLTLPLSCRSYIRLDLSVNMIS